MSESCGAQISNLFLSYQTSLVIAPKLMILKYHLNTSHIYNLQLELHLELQAHINNCSLNSSTWMSKRHLTHKMSSTELLSFNPANLVFSTVFLFSVNGNSILLAAQVKIPQVILGFSLSQPYIQPDSKSCQICL